MLHRLLAKHHKTAKRSISLMLCLILLLSTWGTMVAFATTEDSAEAESTIRVEDPEQFDEGELDQEETMESEQGEENESENSLPSANNAISPAADEGVSPTSISGSTTVAVGSTITLTGSTSSNNNHTWTSSDTSVATVSGTGTTATVTGVSAGTVTITHTYYTSSWFSTTKVTETYTVTVTSSTISSSNEVTVYVYVSGYDPSTGEYFSSDMLSLLNVSTLDAYGYFAVGTITVDTSLLSGTSSSLIASEADWEIILAALENLDTSASKTDPNNLIKDYINQIIHDISATQNGGYSGLWVSLGASNYDVGTDGKVNSSGILTSSGSYTWHLDLRFDLVNITYIYGNNDLDSDGITAGTKVFIKGATMDYQPSITVPNGYKLVGYYTDKDCTDGNEWSAINQPINENTVVYIKIVPINNTTIYYKIAEGSGELLKTNESFVYSEANVVGSTATAAAGWVFDGWYYDEECTKLASNDANFVPTAPEGGWVEGENYTYYAKFVQNTVSLDLTKEVYGNMADLTGQFSFEVKYVNVDGETVTEEITLEHLQNSETITVIKDSTVTITELGYSPYTVTAAVNGENVAVTDGVITFVVSENSKVVVTNTYNVTPETGILLDVAPYALLLCVAVLGLVVMLGKKKVI